MTRLGASPRRSVQISRACLGAALGSLPTRCWLADRIEVRPRAFILGARGLGAARSLRGPEVDLGAYLSMGEQAPEPREHADPSAPARHTSGSEALARRTPAVLLAGDRAHSRAVAGRSKPFVEVAGRSMVEHVLSTLLRTPELGDIFVIGDAPRLQERLATSGLIEEAFARGHAVHVLSQRTTLYENVWHAFLASLPLGDSDLDRAVLVVPADIPLAIPEEISSFVRQAWTADVDYVLGLTPDVALAPFAPSEGRPGIEMACFNLAEGRFRQNNLHLVRPLRMRNRHYIQDMYESRYQKELGSMIRLVLRLMVREYRKLWVLGPYLLLHLGGVLDRRGYTRGAALVRRFVSLRTIEKCVGALLGTRFVTVITGLGGAALDVDNDADRAAADKMLPTWRSLQTELARTAMLSEH